MRKPVFAKAKTNLQISCREIYVFTALYSLNGSEDYCTITEIVIIKLPAIFCSPLTSIVTDLVVKKN